MTDPVVTSESAVPADQETQARTPDAPALQWWRRYCGPDAADPAARAQLRRCDAPVDAAAIPAAIALAQRVGAFARDDDRRLTDALNLARVLAHVREHTPGPPMRAAGWKHFAAGRRESEVGAEERPRLSEARFRRLLVTGGGEEQVTAFIRLVAILDGKMDVARLAEDFLRWSHPWRGEETRKRWAVDYYAARSTDHAAEPLTTTLATTPTTEDDA